MWMHTVAPLIGFFRSRVLACSCHNCALCTYISVTLCPCWMCVLILADCETDLPHKTVNLPNFTSYTKLKLINVKFSFFLFLQCFRVSVETCGVSVFIYSKCHCVVFSHYQIYSYVLYIFGWKRDIFDGSFTTFVYEHRKKGKISTIRKLLEMHFLFNILFFSCYISSQVDTNGLLQ